MLARFYRELKETRDDFEIVFVSSDKSKVEFAAYAAQMPWLSIDWERRDLQGALGQAFGVQGIPTLVWLDRDGSVITTEGRKKVTQEPEKFPWAQGAGSQVAAGTVGSYELLNGAIETRNSMCLNLDDDSSDLGAVLTENGGQLKSDADEQLLFNFVFNQTVKVHSFQLLGPAGKAPKRVSVFVNRVAIGFEDAEDLKPTERFELTAEQASNPKADPVLLNFVLYQKIAQFAIFVESNQEDGEQTVVSHVKLYGLK